MRALKKSMPELEDPWHMLEKAKKLGIVRIDLMPSEFTHKHARLVKAAELAELIEEICDEPV